MLSLKQEHRGSADRDGFWCSLGPGCLAGWGGAIRSTLSPADLALPGGPGQRPAQGSAGVGWLPLCNLVFATTCPPLDATGTAGTVGSGLLVVLDVSCYSALPV